MAQRLHDAGFMSEADTSSGDTMNKKIRNAQLQQFNYILGNLTDKNGVPLPLLSVSSSLIPVVGEKEVSNDTVNVRTRDNVVHGEVTLQRLLERFEELRELKVIEEAGGF